MQDLSGDPSPNASVFVQPTTQRSPPQFGSGSEISQNYSTLVPKVSRDLHVRPDGPARWVPQTKDPLATAAALPTPTPRAPRPDADLLLSTPP